MSVNSKMTAIADAIRDKTDLNSALTLDQMAEAIAGIATSYGKIVSTVDCTTMTASGTFFGDVNNDGVIDSTDIELIGMYILTGEEDIDTEAADLDGNGIVSTEDVLTLGKIIERLTDGQIIAKIDISYDDGSTERYIALVDAPIAELKATDDGEGNIELLLSKGIKVTDDGTGNVAIE